jgi:hypothetical protein
MTGATEDPAPTIVGFADDTARNERLVCAVVLLSSAQRLHAESILRNAKASVGVAADVPIHCRQMFLEAARRKTPWRFVSRRTIQGMLWHLCETLKPLSERPVVCMIERSSIPPGVGGAGSMFEGLEDKGIATFAYVAAFTHIAQSFPAQSVRVFIDRDKTKIPWGPGRKQQAQLTRQVDLDSVRSRANERFVAHPVSDPKPALLELADLYAWMTARAHYSVPDAIVMWCRELYRVIDPTPVGFEFSSTQQWPKTAAHILANPDPT